MTCKPSSLTSHFLGLQVKLIRLDSRPKLGAGTHRICLPPRSTWRTLLAWWVPAESVWTIVGLLNIANSGLFAISGSFTLLAGSVFVT